VFITVKKVRTIQARERRAEIGGQIAVFMAFSIFLNKKGAQHVHMIRKNTCILVEDNNTHNQTALFGILPVFLEVPRMQRHSNNATTRITEPKKRHQQTNKTKQKEKLPMEQVLQDPTPYTFCVV